MTYPSLQNQLQQQIEPGDVLVISIFGTANIHEISKLLNSYCQQKFSSKILNCSFAYLSVGATFVVQLRNLQPIVLKAYSSQQQTLSSLHASLKVQQAMAEAGFPCPQVIQFPQQIGATILTAQTFCDDGLKLTKASGEENSPFVHQRSHPNDIATVRRTMAQHLAQLIQQSKPYLDQDLSIWMESCSPALWPQPHNVLFDFEKTAAGAKWIDEIAQPAKQILRAATGPLIVGHSDWSLQNMSFSRSKLICVYDWDSLRIGLEPCFVGGAARLYRHDWRIGPPEPPISLAEVHDFIKTYEIARRQPFTDREHRILGAAIVYTAAYGMRCAHAVHSSKSTHYQNAKHQLRQFANTFLL